MEEEIIHTIIKSFCMNIYILFVDLKINNIQIKRKHFFKIVCASISITIIYSIIQIYIDNILKIIITFYIQIIFLKLIIEDKRNVLFITNIISNSIVYIIFLISVLIESIIIYIYRIIDSPNINLLIILGIESVLLITIFSSRRLKRGLIFLNKKLQYDFIEIILINISGIIILVYYICGNYYENIIKQLIICWVILGMLMIIIIQKTLTLYYKERLKDRNIEDMKNEIAEKDKKIKELSDEKYKISKLNHEFDNRQKALKLKLQEFINNSNIETGSEISILSDIENLSKEYVGKIEDIKKLDKLPTTEIDEIDDMFRYMQVECKKNNIDFKLQVNGNIHHMVNKLIPQNKLVTLIGDHLKDAIIAINASDNKFRSIFAFIGKKEDYYEFSVLDSGIEFENNTLLKLGIKPITTHKDSGGTGFGFMTTFETMKETNASLIIEEKHEMTDNDYTKSVTIRFDGKNEYRISSYKAKEIFKNMKDNRIILDFLK